MSFTVLFVCTGNICRSPMAERLLRARLRHRTPVETSSAGTAAVVGHPIDAPIAAQLRTWGADPEGHVARRLTGQMIADADLVLTAAGTHRSDVMQTEPAAFRRTFTMREFARLGSSLGRLAGADEAALRARVAQVAALRGTGQTLPPNADDIADPFGAPQPIVVHSARQVSDAVDGVIAALGVERPSPRRPATQSR